MPASLIVLVVELPFATCRNLPMVYRRGAVAPLSMLTTTTLAEPRISERWRWLVPPIVAAAIWLVPHAGFDAGQWGLLCLFAGTIGGLIVRPLPAGGVVL